jgi:tRNA-specific 2-thiouridylase
VENEKERANISKQAAEESSGSKLTSYFSALELSDAQTFRRSFDSERTVAMLMSGGVDSSTAAMLLMRDGWEVVGFTMNIPTAQGCDYRRSCCGIEAAYVAKHLGVPHYFIDVRKAFVDLVIEPFRRAYERGETPSPCVDCNTVIKFGLVWDFIEEKFGIRRMATGHYARIVRFDNTFRLARAKDLRKDQSYFLYGISARRLQDFLLPIGELTKQEVRDLARQAKLPVARRRESMELCFAGEGDYRKALEIQPKEGPILDMDGREIGRHSGIANFTIGQRKGIGIAAGKPLYVVRIDAQHNSITVGEWHEVSRRDVKAREINVLVPEELQTGTRLLGKIRSQGEPAGCVVTEIGNDLIEVRFDKAQFAPTPGQRLVLYNEQDHVIAGGIIC